MTSAGPMALECLEIHQRTNVNVISMKASKVRLSNMFPNIKPNLQSKLPPGPRQFQPVPVESVVELLVLGLVVEPAGWESPVVLALVSSVVANSQAAHLAALAGQARAQAPQALMPET